MNKLLSFAALLLVFAGSAWAYDFSAVAPTGQTLYYNIFGSSSAWVVCPGNQNWSGYTQPTGALTIPDSVTCDGQTYPVISVGESAFRGCTGLTGVTIPSSATSIGDYAFYGCDSLASVTIPSSVTSIGDVAFGDCTGLTGVTIPNSVTSIGNGAFSGSGLTSVTIPNSVTSIGALTFANCSSLTSVTIGSGVTSIGGRAFGECTSLASVTIGNAVTSIGEYAFYGCSSLASITIPNSVTSIGGRAFEYCSGLTGVVIGNGVTSIGEFAFYECSGLASVTVGNSVASIGFWAFNACSGLTRVDYTGTIADWCGISFAGIDANPLYYAHHLYIDNSEITHLAIPNTVTSIGNSAFAGCSGLTSAVIPSAVTSIGAQAFYECRGLTSVTIPNAVTSILERTFMYCTSLAGVTIPNAVTSIGEYAFASCGLASVTIGSGVASIGDSAFRNCGFLTEITSLARVAPTLGAGAFANVAPTIPVNIPCDSSSVASYDSLWSCFTNFVESIGFELSAASADSAMGSVQVLEAPSCASPNAVIQAVANSGYHFDHWSDGNTDSLRTLVLTCDTDLLAYFAPDGGGEGIAEAVVATYAVRAVAGGVVIEGAAGREVRLYDIQGRLLRQLRADRDPLQLEVSHGGIYLLQIDGQPAQKVAVY